MSQISEQDQQDILTVCEALFFEQRPFSLQAEAAYVRICGRYDLSKIVKTYWDGMIAAALSSPANTNQEG